jgi:DNA-binding CsgD family transcriptional regulator
MAAQRSVRFAVGGQDFMVLSVPIGASELRSLSRAEREVIHAVLEGLSTSEIASRRGRSERTVAAQLASAYRKLNVHSRAELAALLSTGD